MLTSNSLSAEEPVVAAVESELPPYMSTESAAKLLSYTPATLRNYAWLQSLTAKERGERMLQDPPDGLPKPSRKRGRLIWKTAQLQKWLRSRPA